LGAVVIGTMMAYGVEWVRGKYVKAMVPSARECANPSAQVVCERWSCARDFEIRCGARRARARRMQHERNDAVANLSSPRATLPSVRDAFNAAIDRPRLIVFFSSACASCDTGSAALQAMLEKLPTPVSVFAVWEPIATVDAPPTSHMLGNLKAPHVHQLWDPAHVISDEMRAAELAHPSSPPQARTRTDSLPDGIMYDTMAVFAPGARWEATLPGADYLEVGLESKLDELRQQLETLSQEKQGANEASSGDLPPELDSAKRSGLRSVDSSAADRFT